MVGGGRRPLSNRRSSPTDVSRRSVSPPARRNLHGNAGYASVSHGSDGRFTSNGKALPVQDNGSPVLGQSTFGATDSLEILNNAMGTAPSQVTTMEEGAQTIHESGTDFKQQLVAIGNPQSKHGDASLNDSMLMDDGVLHKGVGNGNLARELSSRRMDNGQHAAAHSNEGGNLDPHVNPLVNASSPLSVHNLSDVCMTVEGSGPAPTAFDNCNSPSRIPLLGDDCNVIAGNDKNSSVRCMQGACHNASTDFYSNSATTNVWKKHGVVPLPSLKDLGAGSHQDGVAHLDNNEVQHFVEKFQVALVGRLFGRRLPFYYLNAELKRRWECFGHFKVLTVSSDCFICLFETAAARDNVLMGGPWVIAGQVLGLDVWTSGFSPTTMHGFVTPIWVRFPGLPLYCWGSNSLTHIASLLGRPIWCDQATATMERGAYARVCVQTDLSKPLVASVTVHGLDGPFQQRVEYEGLTNFCFKCGRVGHKDVNCPEFISSHGKVNSIASNALQGAAILQKEVISTAGNASPFVDCEQQHNFGNSNAASHPAVAHNSSAPAAPSSKPYGCVEDLDGLGPWMLVQRRRKQPNHPRKSPRNSLQPARGDPMEATVQNLKNGKIQNFSTPQLQVSAVDACLQEPPVLETERSLLLPKSKGNEAMVFSSLSPKIFSNAPAHPLVRVNSNRDTKHKKKGSFIKEKQVFYDAGPLIVESHKKRRPSIQSTGEDASSTAPG